LNCLLFLYMGKALLQIPRSDWGPDGKTHILYAKTFSGREKGDFLTLRAVLTNNERFW